MSLPRIRTPVGELRPSQLLHTFGVGAVVDLPHLSVLVMGLDDWDPSHLAPVVEDRLLAQVRRRLGPQVERMVAPPVPEETGGLLAAFDEPATGVPVAPFPRYLRCPACNLLSPLSSGLFKLRTVPGRPDRTRYVHEGCNKLDHPAVLPARFLFACRRGHVDDFPWHWFVHKGDASCHGQLRLIEMGVTGEAADVLVRCDCGASRSMVDAFGDKPDLPRCRGRRPHLRDFEEEPCDEKHRRTILLGASNSWFAMTLSALYVPPSAEDDLARLVESRWETLSDVEDVSTLKFLRKRGELPGFDGWDDAAILAAIERRREGAAESADTEPDLKVPEWRAFSDPDPARNGRDFLLTSAQVPAPLAPWISRVVLVERLRAVTALVGFSRIFSPRDYAEDESLPSRMRAPLSRKDPVFVPAAEVRGEGVFLQFDEARIAEWEASQEAREAVFRQAHTQWRRRRSIENPEAGFPGMRYVLLHSFAHAFMRELSLEAGYSAASIRERVYARGDETGEPMAGVLLYTAAPDSEGTLGGLVRMGRPGELERHVQRALSAMALCSSDPLCADHAPEVDGSTLHGAACHACLFAPETSCERGNKYLDRGVLVETLAGSGDGFFGRGRS